MSNKFSELNEKIADTVVGSYRKIEDSVVSAYQEVVDSVVGAYQKVEDKMVEQLFLRGNESIDQAKARLRGKDK